MRVKTVIKWVHCLSTLFLLALVIGFIFINHTSDVRINDELIRAEKISDSRWLYVTRYSGGGATVPVIYRYYLANELKGTTEEKLKTLLDQQPIIMGTGSVSNIQLTEDGSALVTYSGKVYSLSGNVKNLELIITP